MSTTPTTHKAPPCPVCACKRTVRKGKRRNRLQTLQVFQCRVELKKSAVVVGDIYTPRIVIEDGASLKGSVQVQKDIPRPQTKKEDAAATVK